MLIKQKDYVKLKDYVKKGVTRIPPLIVYKEKGLSEKRYRWDLVRASMVTIGDGRGMPGDIDLYSYMNDTHIDTALKKIVKELKNG